MSRRDFPEFNFADATVDQIVEAFFLCGCVLLRRFLREDRLRSLNNRLAPIYEEHQAIQVFPPQFRPTLGGDLHEFLFDSSHFELLTALFKTYDWRVFTGTLARRIVGSSGGARWMPPLAPHLDAFYHKFNFTTNFWIPLQACDGDPSSLGVVSASFAEMIDFTGFNGAEPEHAGREKWNFGNFRPEMYQMNFKASSVVEELFTKFSGRIWTPTYEVGDAMLISNWTMHFTHAKPDMRAVLRENLELRFICDASLDDVLAEHDCCRVA